MNRVAETSHEASTQGRFNYLAAGAQSSLYRNGKVLTRRDGDGSDSGRMGIDLEVQQVPVRDARTHSGPGCTLHTNGFEIAPSPLEPNNLDFFDHDQVIACYYPDCAALVQATAGASEVVAFDHNVRSATGKQHQQRIKGGQQVQGPAHLVHGDYTLTSAPQRLHDLAQPPSANDTLRAVLGPNSTLLDPARIARTLASGRFAIINVWRNITEVPVATHPLALCDAQSVRPDDLVVFEIHYADRVGENYFAKYQRDHRWFYYPELTRDEALLIKQWDSAGALARSGGAQADATQPTSPCTFSFHSAFDDPATPADAPERWSIEVRCVVLYD